jgi:hypothetical protein
VLGPARIGGWGDEDPGRTLQGAIDEVRLYDRPLRDEEIIALHAAAQPVP